MNDHFEKQKGKFTVYDKKAEKKKVWYLDTEKHELRAYPKIIFLKVIIQMRTEQVLGSFQIFSHSG
jgi:hypothetical protein